MSADPRTTQRSIANQALTKILLMGLGGSTLLHTVAIAGVSYWAHNHPDEQMEIVEIDRVEVDPQPSPTPLIKPISTPEPKVVKPPVAVSIPTPIPVKVQTPKVILTPTPVVKITKSAATKPSPSPLSNIVSPPVNQAAPPVKIASIKSQKSNPTPSFPNKLFSDPPPKDIPFKPAIEDRTQTPKIVPQQPKIANTPPKSSPIQDPQPLPANNQTALIAENEPAKPAPNPIANPIANSPTAEKLSPILPSNTSRLAPTMDRSTPSENPPNNDRDLTNKTPANNTRITQNNGGDNGTKLGNKPNLGGGDRQGLPIDSNLTSNNSNSGGSNQPSPNPPGNIATGSKNRVSIQCLRNCEIRYPDELENSDIGKDKILVKVTIDPNGIVTNAEIDRSSGNQNLDRVTLAGVKQMQLNATGQTRTHRIKISTLLR